MNLLDRNLEQKVSVLFVMLEEDLNTPVLKYCGDGTLLDRFVNNKPLKEKEDTKYYSREKILFPQKRELPVVQVPTSPLVTTVYAPGASGMIAEMQTKRLTDISGPASMPETPTGTDKKTVSGSPNTCPIEEPPTAMTPQTVVPISVGDSPTILEVSSVIDTPVTDNASTDHADQATVSKNNHPHDRVPAKRCLISEGPDAEMENDNKRSKFGVFSFKQQEASVAVAFDDNVYIGQVMDIKSNNMATVKFLRQIKGAEQSGAFKWPQIDDVSDVDSKFIVDMNSTILPCGRTVKIPGYDQILEKFQLYQELYMD